MNLRPLSFRADAAVRPWYRERWPWLLISGPAIVVVASLVSAWIALRSDDGLVAEDYYKRGLLINRKLADEPPVTGSETGATLEAADDGKLHVRLEGFAAAPAHLRLVLAEPGASQVEEVVELSAQADGGWVGAQPGQTAGRRIVRLEADAAQFPVTTIVGRLTELRLGTAAHRR